ncbi:MAG: hypothetical protein AAF526_01755 [Pseudomonadota bacterium]
MIVQFDQARERIDDVDRFLRESFHGGPNDENEITPEELDMLKCIVLDSIDAICVQMPTTADAIRKRVKGIETRDELSVILGDLRRIQRPWRVQLAGEEDSAYFSALVDKTLLRSTFFRMAMVGIASIIVLAAGLIGFRVVTGGNLQADVAAQLQANEERLLNSQRIMSEIQRDMLNEIGRAESIAEEVEKSAEAIEKERERVGSALARISTDAQNLTLRLDDIREERADWEAELPELQLFFDTQRNIVTSSVATLLEQEESVGENVKTTSEHAKATETALGSAQAALRDITDIRMGLEQRTNVAENALADVSAAVSSFQQRLDSQRGAFDETLASGIALEADLRTAVSNLEQTVTEWMENSATALQQVQDAAFAASNTIQQRSEAPLTVLTSRQNTAGVIIDALQRGEQEATSLLSSVRDLHAEIREEEVAIARAAEGIRTTLRDTERQRLLLQALVDQVDGRRDEAEAELARLLANQLPIDLAMTWQAALQGDRSALALLGAAIAVILSAMHLLIALIRWAIGYSKRPVQSRLESSDSVT